MQATKHDKMDEITLGSDPELFLYDTEQKKIVSAIPVLGKHDKYNPIDLGDGIKMYLG